MNAAADLSNTTLAQPLGCRYCGTWSGGLMVPALLIARFDDPSTRLSAGGPGSLLQEITVEFQHARARGGHPGGRNPKSHPTGVRVRRLRLSIPIGMSSQSQ